jgi:uncharacterized protein YndB with AHSA1/START domain
MAMTNTMTDTATDHDTTDYTATVAIDATPETVFDALATLQGLGSWWTSQVEGNATSGGKVTFKFGGGPNTFHVDEAQAAVVRWTCELAQLDEWPGTVVEFRLSPEATGGTTLSFVHHGLTPKFVCYDECKSGWDYFLPSLRAYCETGVGTPWIAASDS